MLYYSFMLRSRALNKLIQFWYGCTECDYMKLNFGHEEIKMFLGVTVINQIVQMCRLTQLHHKQWRKSRFFPTYYFYFQQTPIACHFIFIVVLLTLVSIKVKFYYVSICSRLNMIVYSVCVYNDFYQALQSDK